MQCSYCISDSIYNALMDLRLYRFWRLTSELSSSCHCLLKAFIATFTLDPLNEESSKLRFWTYPCWTAMDATYDTDIEGSSLFKHVETRWNRMDTQPTNNDGVLLSYTCPASTTPVSSIRWHHYRITDTEMRSEGSSALLDSFSWIWFYTREKCFELSWNEKGPA